MADTTDPLSTATRATKRNLLLASVLGISANAFRVSIDKIPVAGLSINFDGRLFSFLLLCALLYFLATFILYYSIDINNFSATPHQTESETIFQRRVSTFSSSYTTQMRNDMQARTPDGFRISLAATPWDPATLKFDKALTYKVERLPPGGNRWVPATPEDLHPFESQFRQVDKRLAVWVKRHRWAQRRNNWFARGHLLKIRLLYQVRNYFVDGFLPVFLALIALAAVTGLINLSWLQHLVPNFDSFAPYRVSAPSQL